MTRGITVGRVIVAVITTSVEEVAFYVIWRMFFPGAPLAVPVAVMAAWLGFCVWLFFFVTRALKRRPAEGMISMVGIAGRAAGPLSPAGMVRIRGETWEATSVEGNIKPGEEVVVVGEEGLKLKVRRLQAIKN